MDYWFGGGWGGGGQVHICVQRFELCTETMSAVYTVPKPEVNCFEIFETGIFHLTEVQFRQSESAATSAVYSGDMEALAIASTYLCAKHAAN